MNIMLVAVTERTREIGIRRAIGARRREILYQFLLESILISGGGAILGVFGREASPILAQPLLPDGIRVPVPWYAVVLALAVSCLTGVFFGYLPASKAAACCNPPNLSATNNHRSPGSANLRIGAVALELLLRLFFRLSSRTRFSGEGPAVPGPPPLPAVAGPDWRRRL